MRRLLPLLAALAGPLALAPAGAAALTFSAPAALPDSLPTATAQRGGGEPSAAFDPLDATLYVASPGAPDHGGNLWRSTDGGRTFGAGLSVGSIAGGGDSDVAVDSDAPHTLYYIDLEDLVASDLCRSTDHGASFPSGGCSDNGFATNQQQPASDRPWITTVPGRPGLLYGTYDGLAFGGGAPEVQRSTDGGTTFAPCGQVLEPGSGAFAHFSPSGALENSEVIGKPAVGPAGQMYVPFTEPHVAGQQLTSPIDPTPSNLYLGIAADGCPAAGSTFHDVTVFADDQGAGSDFVGLFPSVAVDPAGNVFVLAAGRLHAGQKGDGVYLFVSRDGGQSFGSPITVNAPLAPQAAQLPSLATGKAPGEVLIGWYGATNTADHNDPAGQWRYEAAETFDFGQTFARAEVTPSTYHYGDVCNLGVLCAVTGGNRRLLDFTTVAVDPTTGCGFAVFAGDPFNTPQATTKKTAAGYTAAQTDGPCLTVANAGQTSAPTTAVARGRLVLSPSPRTVIAGSCRRFAFRVTSRATRRPVPGATVRFAGARARTDRHGVAHITHCLRSAGAHVARASKRGFTGARATVTARSAPRFTG